MRFKFRYSSSFIKWVIVYGSLAKNAAIPRLVTLFILKAVAFITTKIGILDGLEEFVLSDSFVYPYTRVILCITLIWVGIYIVFPKGAYVTNNSLIIARFTVTLTNWHNVVRIKYDDIAYVGPNFNNILSTKYRFSLLAGGDYSNNVEIVLKNGRHYYLSVKEQYEFCDLLKSKIGADEY